jgi:hypothetical protein
MIDIEIEEMHLLARASTAVPGKPHVTTLYRWALHGVRGVRLETVIVGGRRFTSREAIGRFLATLNGGGALKKVVSSKRRKAELGHVESSRGAEGM